MNMFKTIYGSWLGLLGLILFFRPSISWFENCDHNVPLGPNGAIYINSPYYPNRYPSGSSCIYKVSAPLDYEMNVQCNVSLDSSGTYCGTEFFYISTDGTTDLTGSEYFCGTGYVQRKSLFNQLTLAYRSSSSNFGGSFSCLVQTVAQPCDCGWTVSSKIVGGVEAQPNEYPSLVGMVYAPDKRVFCVGTIITHRYVLTAAHCLVAYPNPSELGVLSGEHDITTGADSGYTQLHKVQQIKMHEYYDSETDRNDIGLVKTVNDIQWSRGVGPACLPYYFRSDTFAGRYVDIAGWGTSSYAGPTSTVLMKAQVNVITNNQCQSAFPNLVAEQMCTYSPPKDSCQYDSGGPLLLRYNRMYVVGVISFGIACGTDVPSVNTRLSSYLSWIEYNTGDKFCVK